MNSGFLKRVPLGVSPRTCLESPTRPGTDARRLASSNDLENLTMTKSRTMHGFTIVELLIVIAVVAVLLTLCLPFVQHARNDARRLQCQNNLKQIGLALHNYHNVTKVFPPGWTQHHPLPGPQTRFGWSVFILPYMDQAPLYKRLEFQDQRAEPMATFQTRIVAYRCPSDPSGDINSACGDLGTMNYSGNFGPVAPPRWMGLGLDEFWPGSLPTPTKADGLAFLNSRVRIADISDGTSQTFLVGERSANSGAGIWMGVRGNEYESDQVTDCSPGRAINSGFGAFSSLHDGGANFLFCDGRVVFLSQQIESGSGEGQQMRTYQKLSHRSDGMTIGEFE